MLPFYIKLCPTAIDQGMIVAPLWPLAAAPKAALPNVAISRKCGKRRLRLDIRPPVSFFMGLRRPTRAKPPFDNHATFIPSHRS